MAKQKIELIIFDYDDTLINRNIHKIFSDFPNNHRIAELVAKDIGITKNIELTLRNVFNSLNLSLSEEKIKDYSQKYISCYTEGVFEENIKSLLRKLSKKLKLVILTDGKKELKINELKKNGILDLFQEVISSRTEGISKKCPEIYLNILKRYNLKPEQAVMIGNSYSSDIIPAREAGIKTIWVTHLVADRVIKKLEDLDEKDIFQL